MDAGKKQLADILNGNRVLEVPYYQRSYVWNEEQWSRFISDMEYITSTNKDYFLGSIILKQQPTGISPFDIQSIIDGQQRFTTFALFFKSLCCSRFSQSSVFIFHISRKIFSTISGFLYLCIQRHRI